MQSQFNAQTLAEIFRDLYLSERSGVLLLARDELEKRVYFDRGMILFGESSLEEESLGPFLVREGDLSAGALAEAHESLGGPAGTPELAAVLVQRELIGRATLRKAVRAIVKRVVETSFTWEGGSARFNEGPAPDTLFETDILWTVEVILHGVFQMAGFEPIHDAMQGLDNRLSVRKPTPIPLEGLALSPQHGFILSRLDGHSNLGELISILPSGEEEIAARFVFGLLVLGVIDYEPSLGKGPFKVSDILRDHADRQALECMQEQMIRQTYMRIRQQNPQEILNLPQAANHAQIERAYEAAKEPFGRDRLLPKVREKFRSELTVIESRHIESFLALTQPNRRDALRASEERIEREAGVEVQDLNVRVEMDRAKSKVAQDQANGVADAYYAHGKKFMREGDYHNAIQYGKLAISYNPSDARYYNLIACCQSRNPEARWQRMAEENYTKATELDPWNPEYWISLGRLYKKRGLKLRARKQFEEALKLVPNHPEVMSELETLG